MRFLVVIASLCIVACSTQMSQPDCVDAKNADDIVRWGNVYADGSVRGYELVSTAEFSSFDKPSMKAENQTVSALGRLESDTYCEATQKVRQTFAKVQVLHSPGERSRFVEFVNHRKGVYLRALWNPDFQNIGNEEFSKLYTYLESLEVLD